MVPKPASYAVATSSLSLVTPEIPPLSPIPISQIKTWISAPRAAFWRGSDHCTGKGIKLAVPALDGDKPCTKTACLFNVKEDPSESNDLAGHSKYASLITDLTAALDAAAKTGPPFAETFEDKKDDKAAKAQICAIATGMGFVEPADCDTCGSVPPVPPSPSPSPSPAPPSPGPPSCIKACEKDCPSESFKSYDDCLKCTRDSSECSGKCKPKERKAFCGAETSAFSVV